MRLTLSALLCLTLLHVEVSAQFGAPVFIGTGEHVGVKAADLDGDLDNDLVFGTMTGYYWTENTDGLGTFGTPVLLATVQPSQAQDVFALRDMDGDDDTDVVMFDHWNEEVLWVENDGLGGFAAPQVLFSTAGFDDIRGLECASITGSALPEVIMLDRGTVFWFVNDAGSFAASDSLVHCTVLSAEPLLIGDVDNDGDLDHAVTCGTSMSIGFNDGTGTSWTINTLDYNAASHYGAGTYWMDADADNDLDMVDADWDVHWVENMTSDNGAWGGDTAHVVAYAPNEGAGWATHLGCGTGASILWCHWPYVKPIMWSYYDETLGAFTPPAPVPSLPPAGDRRLFFGDLNGDGAQDVMIFRNDTLRWYPNEIGANVSTAAVVPPLDTLCSFTNGNYPLPEGAPGDGLWSGPGINAFLLDNTFNVSSVGGTGSFELHYAAVDTTGCIAHGSGNILLTQPDAWVDPNQACPLDRIQVLGLPVGGTWSAYADSLGYINTECAVRPIFGATNYTYTDPTGNQCNDMVVITVQACAPTGLVPLDTLCENDPVQAIGIAGPVNGSVVFLEGVDSVDVISMNPPQTTGWFSPGQGPGTYLVIAWANGSQMCPHPDTIWVVVEDAPDVALDLGVDSITDCSAVLPLSSGAPAGGTYTIDGSLDPYTVFEAAVWGPGVHYVSYTIEDTNGCAGVATDTLIVDCLTGLDQDTYISSWLVPNPSVDEVSIGWKGVGMMDILVTDAAGRTMLRYAAARSPMVMEVSGFAKGIYHVHLGGVQQHRLVVQ